MPTDAEQHKRLIGFLLKENPLTEREIFKKLKEKRSLVQVRLLTLQEQKRVDLRDDYVYINEDYRKSLFVDSLEIEDDLEFLSFLDKKLRYQVDQYYGQGSQKRWYKANAYTNDKITEQEISRIQKALDSRNDLVFSPSQGSFGFHPTFTIIQVMQEHPDVPSDLVCLLNFDQDQYRGKESFDELEPLWKTDKNLRLIQYHKLPKIESKSLYFY